LTWLGARLRCRPSRWSWPPTTHMWGGGGGSCAPRHLRAAGRRPRVQAGDADHQGSLRTNSAHLGSRAESSWPSGRSAFSPGDGRSPREPSGCAKRTMQVALARVPAGHAQAPRAGRRRGLDLLAGRAADPRLRLWRFAGAAAWVFPVETF
jgi:hypothetical protein